VPPEITAQCNTSKDRAPATDRSIARFASGLAGPWIWPTATGWAPTPAEPIGMAEPPSEGGGKVRVLSIPAIRDRVVQGALKLILEPIFEADFQPGSFGYRPKKSAQEAVDRVAKAIDRCKTRVIDLDLRSYFDNVRHDLLLVKVAKRSVDPPKVGSVDAMYGTAMRWNTPPTQGPSLRSGLCCPAIIT
jgi:hypothetical protein